VVWSGPRGFALGVLAGEGPRRVRGGAGRRLTPEQRQRFIAAQLKALRWTFIGSGITHPNFLATVATLGPGLREKLEAVAPAFC
jgi:hypothetical protein